MGGGLEWLQALASGDAFISDWLILSAAALAALVLFVAIVRSEMLERVMMMFLIGALCFAVIGMGALAYRQNLAVARAAQARSLFDRASALSAAMSGDGLGCLDGDEKRVALCEVALFERPDILFAAKALTRARFDLVQDASVLAATSGDPGLVARVIVWRDALQRDTYGLLAQALSESGCTATLCPALAVLPDPSQVMQHMSEHRFETLVTKYTPVWERNARIRSGGVRTGPFGLTINDGSQPQAGAPEAGSETPGMVNLPVEVEETPATPPQAAPAAPVPREEPKAQSGRGTQQGGRNTQNGRSDRENRGGRTPAGSSPNR